MGGELSSELGRAAAGSTRQPCVMDCELDAGVKYFSGTATYLKEIYAPKEWFQPDRRLMLDLGTVKEIAEVSVNGTAVGGILWKPPFLVTSPQH